jgi:hypothetical protein
MYNPAVDEFPLCRSSTVSTENADIVVKAPRIPVPRNNAKSADIRFCERLNATIPRKKEPITFTNIVAKGKVSNEIHVPIEYLKQAPIAPPRATSPIC